MMTNSKTQTIVVEDSVTHQAGDGITANRPNAIETSDIFDNDAQVVVKQQKEDETFVDDSAVRVSDDTVQQLTETLSDGSVDIVR